MIYSKRRINRNSNGSKRYSKNMGNTSRRIRQNGGSAWLNFGNQKLENLDITKIIEKYNKYTQIIRQLELPVSRKSMKTDSRAIRIKLIETYTKKRDNLKNCNHWDEAKAIIDSKAM